MLISFSVENFRSFKDRQTLYFNAVKTCKEWNDENTAVEACGRIVRSAVVYGANAGGKTNLFIAIERMRSFMLASVNIDKKIPLLFCEPFLLRQGNVMKPETFEMEFTVDGRHFNYGFSLQINGANGFEYEVVKEWLYEVNKGRLLPFFLREKQNRDNGFVNVISVDKKRMPQGIGLEQRTRADVLFFTVAAQFAEPTCQIISAYIQTSFIVISGVNHQIVSEYSRTRFAADQVVASKIKKLIFDADVGIKDIALGDNGQIISRHTIYGDDGSAAGAVDFNFAGAESQGTQKLFDISGAILDALTNGWVLVVDEFDAKLHPILVRRVIELFNSPETNPKNAQLIFNAQSPDLLGYKTYSETKGKKIARLRRDQFYFVEKDNQEASQVFSLIEFKKESGMRTRNDDSYDKNYLSGVYGGIPFPREMIEKGLGNG